MLAHLATDLDSEEKEAKFIKKADFMITTALSVHIIESFPITQSNRWVGPVIGRRNVKFWISSESVRNQFWINSETVQNPIQQAA